MTAAQGSIQLTWSSYDLTFSEFLNDALPRTFVSTAALRTSATGSQVMSGAPFAARYIWAISAHLSASDAESLMNMFKAFDDTRSTGQLPVIAVDDYTFGSRVTGSAVFTTAPSISRAGAQKGFVQVDFAVSEV